MQGEIWARPRQLPARAGVALRHRTRLRFPVVTLHLSRSTRECSSQLTGNGGTGSQFKLDPSFKLGKLTIHRQCQFSSFELRTGKNWHPPSSVSFPVFNWNPVLTGRISQLLINWKTGITDFSCGASVFQLFQKTGFQFLSHAEIEYAPDLSGSGQF